MEIECIIFECDGVLVDSECMGCKENIALLKKILPIVNERYMNLSKNLDKRQINAINDLVNNGPIILPEHKICENFNKTLKPTQHIKEVLERLTVPYCIASNDSIKSVEYKLRKAGLYSHFQGKIFGSDLIVWPKPAPDIYLYTLNKMNLKPENCLAVENCTSGIHSALSAGIKRTIGYTGSKDSNAARFFRLKDSGAITLFYDMRDLLYVTEEKLQKNLQH
ncbi:MAG TPA: HAD-IA family hydrolase [Alphaproteobacteria bacterium]|nr:HAD-IA family hydrolase [Alphaproteobacteria bacterium]